MLLTEKKFTNVSLENAVFEKNCLVLIKQSERVNKLDESIDVTTRYIEVCELKDTKDITIVKSLLRFVLAETLVDKDFKAKFTDTGIANKKVLTKFLNTHFIFRTDSNGKISKALSSSVVLKNTALNIKDGHALMRCDKDNLRCAIHQHALATLAQTTYLSDVIAKVDWLLDAERKGEKLTTTTTEKGASEQPKTEKPKSVKAEKVAK